jgi:hypothetical protein
MARRLGVTPSAVTQATKSGGMLAPALVGKGINVLHEAAQAWLARKAAETTITAPIDVVATEADDDPTNSASPPSATEAEAALGPWRAQVDLASLVEPLSTLTERYSDAKEFAAWIKCRKALEEALKAQMLRERVAGRLIARTTVQRMIEKIDDAFRLMLTNAPRTIATQIAPNDMARCTQVVRDALEQILSKGQEQMLMSLRADDPEADLVEAAE